MPSHYYRKGDDIPSKTVERRWWYRPAAVRERTNEAAECWRSNSFSLAVPQIHNTDSPGSGPDYWRSVARDLG